MLYKFELHDYNTSDELKPNTIFSINFLISKFKEIINFFSFRKFALRTDV